MFGFDRFGTRFVQIGAVIVVLIFMGVTLAWCVGRGGRDDARIAAATGKALDKVAEQTPVIRQEQAEKQREVDQIEGSDTRLPDGYGKSLERVRRGGGHPRQS